MESLLNKILEKTKLIFKTRNVSLEKKNLKKDRIQRVMLFKRDIERIQYIYI